MRADLGHVRDTPARGTVPVDDEVARAPHRHEVPDAAQHRLAVRPVSKGPRLALAQPMHLSAPVDNGPLGGAREDEAHPRYLGHRGGEARPTALDLVGVEWLGAV